MELCRNGKLGVPSFPVSNVRLPTAIPKIAPKEPAVAVAEAAAALPAIGELLGDDDREPLFQQAMTALNQALVENDINKARIASMLIQAIRRGGKQDDGVKLKVDERFVEAISAMAQSEFRIKSQLAEYEAALSDPSGN